MTLKTLRSESLNLGGIPRNFLAVAASLAICALASPVAADTIEVPGDHATIADAIAAANPGDTILITDSETYLEGTLTINKPITLMAAPDENPTILCFSSGAVLFMAEGSDGAQVGSNDGGRITIDADSVSRDIIRLATAHTDSVAFENLNMINPQATTSGVGLLAFGVGGNVQGVGSATFRDIHLDMNGTGGRAFRLATTAATSVYTFERVEVVNTADGQDPFIVGVNATAIMGGTLNIKDSRFYGGARSIYIFENASKPQWTINVEDSLFRTRESLGAVGIRIDLPDTIINIERSAFYSTASTVLFNGNTRPVGDDGSILTINQSDLVSAGNPSPDPPAIPPPTILIQPPHTSPGDRGLLVKNSILYNTTSDNNVVVIGSGSNDNFGGNNNNAFPGGYEDFSSNNDVTPNEEPDYLDLDGDDFRYNNTAFLTASDTGGHIGSRRNFQFFLDDDVPPPPILGDINYDGVVNVEDVTALANAIAAEIELDPEVADINGDGVIDEADVAALANMIVDGS